MSTAQPSVLLLCNYEPHRATCVTDHIEALARTPGLRVFVRSGHGDLPSAVDLARFDAVAIHYSTFLTEPRHLPSATRRRIAAFSGPKLVFRHDEHAAVRASVGALVELGIDTVFTCVPQHDRPKVYPAGELAGVEFVQLPTGIVPERLRHVRPNPMVERDVDILYRGRRYPAWHGRSGEDRRRIAEQVEEAARAHRWRTDISTREGDRLYGPRWEQALASAKLCLVTDSGSDFAALDDAVPPRELRAIDLRQASPRVMEAAALGCVLAGYPGAWSATLEPWAAFIPIDRADRTLSGLADVLRDDARLSRIAERGREAILSDVALSEGCLTDAFRKAVTRKLAERAAARPYAVEEWRAVAGDFRALPPGSLRRDERLRALHGRYERLIEALPTDVGEPVDRLARRAWRAARAVRRGLWPG